LVLDVGSGHNPHPRADVLCDRFLIDDYERGGALIADRPLVGGDLTCLPFRDQVFGYVICAHVLEHIDDVATALAELARVAPAGYVECPSPMAEYLTGRESHYWLVAEEAGQLVFRRKPQPVLAPELRDRIVGLLRAKDKAYLSFYWTHEASWDVRCAWRGTIPHRIERLSAAVIAFPKSELQPEGASGRPPTPEELLDSGPPGVRGRVRQLVHGAIRRRLASGQPVDLESLVQCPVCRGELVFAREAARMACTGCGGQYPLAGAAPSLLPEMRQRPADGWRKA